VLTYIRTLRAQIVAMAAFDNREATMARRSSSNAAHPRQAFSAAHSGSFRMHSRTSSM
jgi:hypothetical protein